MSVMLMFRAMGMVLMLMLTKICAQYDSCTGNVTSVRDGNCEDENNNDSCGYDGGDCCECSCDDGLTYVCGYSGFDCKDPALSDPFYSCESFSAASCSNDSSSTWVVEDTASASALAEAVACPGVYFEVEWKGTVSVNQTIYIRGGTVLVIVGVGSDAVVHGSFSTRLFAVVDSSLNLNNVQISAGNATVGGAIALRRSSLVLNQTSFFGNTAIHEGGALYAVNYSVISWDKDVIFEGNSAGSYGGAVHAGSGSSLSWSGYTCFYDNEAYVGGALHLGDGSDAQWGGRTFFSNNIAYDGGALSLEGGSSVSWVAGTMFSRNRAVYGGGALYMYNHSHASWQAETQFFNNTAGYDGGSMYVQVDSTVHFGGETIFSGNNASFGGGAIFLYTRASATWTAGTRFFGNSAVYNGGAVSINGDSSASWNGSTSFSNNVVHYDGGALSVQSRSRASWAAPTFFSDNNADIGGGGAVYMYGHSSVSWTSQTDFANNSAGYEGGAIFIHTNCNVVWEGETSFSGNFGSIGGGAIYVYNASAASWAGETLFSNNEGKYAGGAVLVELDSTVSWTGRTLFSSNIASHGNGGAFGVVYSSSATWSGRTSFLNNAANYSGGAVIVIEQSTVSWHDDTLFVSNIASDGNGGAFVVGHSSSATWSGRTSFLNNSASYSGGAVIVFEHSTVSWHDDTLFASNMGLDKGGAIFVANLSHVSWSARTSFVGNLVYGYDGGAIYVYRESSLHAAGETNFSDNTAHFDGGAVAIQHYNNVTWAAETFFSGNYAYQRGGAVYVNQFSNVTWQQTSSFVNNSAVLDGGVVYAEQASTATWQAEVNFSGNSASRGGGAIYVLFGSAALWEARVIFLRNHAEEDGGALFVYDGSDQASPSYVAMNAPVLFETNSCGGNGGAMAVSGSSSFFFSTENVEFIKNHAEVAGGGMFASGLAVGPEFIGLKFVSNSAQVGGGVHATGCGTAITPDQNGYPSRNPSMFYRCEFTNNRAMATGGAMDVGAGIEDIVHSSFTGNTADVGGALRLAGTTTVENCSFIDNTAGEDQGPAVSNIGFVTVLNSSFVDNVFNCEGGTYLHYYEASSAEHAFSVVCDGCREFCEDCRVPEQVPSCVEELEHSRSTGGSTTLQTLLVDPGYWRASNTSTEVLACFNSGACLGGRTGARSYCHSGYEGPYCSVCSEDFTMSLGFICNRCSERAVTLSVTSVVSLIVVILLGLFFYYMLFGEVNVESNVPRRHLFIYWKRRLQSLKIIIVAWQILTQFASVANVVYPDVYQAFLDGIDLLNFDLSWVLSAGCVVDVGFHERLIMSTVGPLVTLTVLGVTYTVATCVKLDSEDAVEKIRQRHYSMALLVTFLVYAPVSSTLFQMFACDDLDDGRIYLRADYRIECDDPRHEALQVYAVFMIIIYTVGIPVLYATLLFRTRKVLMDASARQHHPVARATATLWELYRVDCYYYELVECGRRILLSGMIVFIYPNTAAQVAVATILGVTFMIFSESTAPYALKVDAWVSRIGHAVVCMSMFLALMLKVDITDERSRSQRIFESILIAAHMCMVLLVVVEAALLIYHSVTKTEKEDSEPRFRRSGDVPVVPAALQTTDDDNLMSSSIGAAELPPSIKRLRR